MFAKTADKDAQAREKAQQRLNAFEQAITRNLQLQIQYAQDRMKKISHIANESRQQLFEVLYSFYHKIETKTAKLKTSVALSETEIEELQNTFTIFTTLIERAKTAVSHAEVATLIADAAKPSETLTAPMGLAAPTISIPVIAAQIAVSPVHGKTTEPVSPGHSDAETERASSASSVEAIEERGSSLRVSDQPIASGNAPTHSATSAPPAKQSFFEKELKKGNPSALVRLVSMMETEQKRLQQKLNQMQQQRTWLQWANGESPADVEKKIQSIGLLLYTVKKAGIDPTEQFAHAIHKANQGILKKTNNAYEHDKEVHAYDSTNIYDVAVAVLASHRGVFKPFDGKTTCLRNLTAALLPDNPSRQAPCRPLQSVPAGVHPNRF